MRVRELLRETVPSGNKWTGRFIHLILIVALAYIYGRNIPDLVSSFELPDESVYAWNASYFLGQGDVWEQMTLTGYYGYGYSLLLIPLFKLATSGMQLIKGAYVINILCIIGIYLILCRLITEIAGNKNSLLISCVCFASCLTPYLAANSIKVLPENYLAFWYCAIALLLYLAFAYQKKRYFILLGISGVYIFFIHSRAVVVTVTLLALLFILGLMWGKKHFKSIISAVIVSAVLFVVLYIAKHNIIIYKEAFKLAQGASLEDGNLLSSRVSNLQYLIPIRSLYVFWTKILYVIYASAGIVLPGGICMIKSCVKIAKAADSSDKKYAEAVLKVFIILSFVFMLIACTLLGHGGDIRYTFYGRYYEYMLPLVICICLYSVLDEFTYLSGKAVFGCVIFTILTGLVTIHYCINYLEDFRIRIDTSRLDAFARPIASNHDLHSMLLYIIVISAGLLFLYTLLIPHKRCRYLIIPVIMIVLQSNSKVCIESLHDSYNRLSPDTEIVEYVLKHSDTEEVYIVDDDLLTEPDYFKMQFLIKNKKVKGISQEESEALPKGSYVLVHSNSEYPKNALNSNLTFVMQGFVFVLYQV